MAYEPIRAALESEYTAITRAVAGLEPAAYGRRTRLADWTLHDLLWHLTRDAERAAAVLPLAVAGAPDADYVTYWRRYDHTKERPVNAAPARARVKRDPARRLLNEWARLADAAIAAARDVPPERVVVTRGQRLRARDVVRTLVVEATVHGIDIAPAVARRPWSSDVGLEVTVDTLCGLLGSDPRQKLEWDAFTFVLKGTGRVALTEEEAAVLDLLDGRWPLLA